MSFNFSTVAANGPTPTTPAPKYIQVKAVKLTSADFTTGGTASVKAYLPPDASIVGFKTWTKTTFAGNGVTVVSLQIGVTGTVAKHLAATTIALTGPSVLAIPAGVMGATGAFQDVGAETADQALLFTGTATTGNPTSGEAYVLIEYVR